MVALDVKSRSFQGLFKVFSDVLLQVEGAKLKAMISMAGF
jgi:hypothetical protein